MNIFCVECEKDIEANLVTGEIIYPHRPDLYNLKFYQCPHCKNYVGTHKGTVNPLGCIPTNELKQARIKVHNKLDYLWKSKKYKRHQIYKALSDYFGYEYHNGQTKTVEECEKAENFLIKNFYGDIK